MHPLRSLPSSRGRPAAALFAVALALSLLPACTKTVVEEAPPPAAVPEVMGAAPGPDYVWVGGFWGGGPGHYAWSRGHWDVPPRGHRGWEAARWDHRDGHYVLVEGHWR